MEVKSVYEIIKEKIQNLPSRYSSEDLDKINDEIINSRYDHLINYKESEELIDMLLDLWDRM